MLIRTLPPRGRAATHSVSTWSLKWSSGNLYLFTNIFCEHLLWAKANYRVDSYKAAIEKRFKSPEHEVTKILPSAVPSD